MADILTNRCIPDRQATYQPLAFTYGLSFRDGPMGEEGYRVYFENLIRGLPIFADNHMYIM